MEHLMAELCPCCRSRMIEVDGRKVCSDFHAYKEDLAAPKLNEADFWQPRRQFEERPSRDTATAPSDTEA